LRIATYGASPAELPGWPAVSVPHRVLLFIANWADTYRFAFGRDARVNALLGAGHFLSHFNQLCLPPLFIAWQKTFDVSFAELGLAMAVMAAAAAVMQTPMGFFVDRYGARPFLVAGRC